MAETVNLMTGNTREVGARNARYKVVCRNGVGNCELFDLANDPLEEYPLSRPADCSPFKAGTLTPASPEWHYCRLTDIVATRSFLQASAQGGAAAPTK